MNLRNPGHRTSRAFSLVELLVVIAIIGIIGAFAVPAAGNLLKGSALTQAANSITDQIAGARLHALTKNRVVEVRFYRFADPEQPGEVATDPKSGYFRGLQFLELGDAKDGEGKQIPNPVGKFVRFPNSVMMNPNASLSSLLGTDATSRTVTTPGENDPELPRGVKRNYEYVSFRFLPDGTTNLPLTGAASGRWYITAHLVTDLKKATDNNPPPNFFTWQIEPVSGNSKILRPGLGK